VVEHVGSHEDAKVERRELVTRRGVEGGGQSEIWLLEGGRGGRR
jgi:hypothetical protein